MRYIRTTGALAEKTAETANDILGFDFCKYIDANPKKAQDDLLSVYEFKSIYNGKDIIIIPYLYVNSDEIELWHLIGVDEKNIYVCYGRELIEFSNFTHLEYLEFHTNDHCNLNCAGCSHFCPLVKKEIFTDLYSFKRDINRLRELIMYIGIIRIMGGEPLLNKELPYFVSLCRSVYPLSDIRIVTNGILLNKLSDEIWECFRKNNIKIDISVYPVMFNKIQELIKLIELHGIEIGSIRNVANFEKILHESKTRYFNNIKGCICNNLHNGHIASCQLAFYGKYFNQYYHKKIPFETGQIDLYTVNDGRELMEKLNEPFKACDYCEQYHFSINSELIPWKRYNEVDNIIENDWWIKG